MFWGYCVTPGDLVHNQLWNDSAEHALLCLGEKDGFQSPPYICQPTPARIYQKTPAKT